MLKRWLNFQKPFTAAPYQFQIFDLWRKAFKQARPVWLKLLLADFVLIVVMHFPALMPLFLKWFPFLEAFRIHPFWENSAGFLGYFSQLSEYYFPLLFGFFIAFPVYLGVNLLSLRIAYQRSAPFLVLVHYLSFFWWMNLMSFTLLALFVFFPFVFLLFYLMAKVVITGYVLQYYVGMTFSMFMIILFFVMFCMTLNLTFAARIPVVHAARMSWKAVRQHVWRMFGMVLISYFIWNVGKHTWYLSDIVLMPLNAMAWALLYQRIFGEKGLVE